MLIYNNYYLDLSTADYLELPKTAESNKEDFIFTKTNPYNDDKFVYCEKCKCWEKAEIKENSIYLSCKNVKTGYIVELPKKPQEIKIYDKQKENRKSVIKNIHEKTPYKISSEEYASYIQQRILENEYLVEEDFFKNKNQLDKTIYLINYITDTDNFTFTVKIHQIDKGLLDFFPQNTTSYPAENCFEVKFDLLKNKYEESDLEYLKLLPFQMKDKAIELYKKLINLWANRELTYSPIPKNSTSISYLQALTRYPYCPSLFYIFNFYASTKYKPSCTRTNPECYNEFCKSLKIKDYKNLRKLFIEKPEVLLAYKTLNLAKIKDINLINSILEKKDISIFCDKKYAEVIIFLKKGIKYSSQKKLCNLIFYNIENSKDNYSNYSLYDGLEMYKKLHRKLPKTVQKELYENGFSEYNHDILSEMYTLQKEKNIRFKYSNEQKKFECSYKDYNFYLPKDRNTLVKVGSFMHNCVASYAEQIQNKNCTIVYAMKKNEYKICIEIVENQILQKREKYNSVLDTEEEEVMEWFENKFNLIV